MKRLITSFLLVLPVSVSTAFVHHNFAERTTHRLLLPLQTQLRITARPLARSLSSLLYSTRDHKDNTARRNRRNKKEEQQENVSSTHKNDHHDQQEEVHRSIPEIRTLRETIQYYARLRSREGPKNAAHALRQLFKYYPPVPIPTTVHPHTRRRPLPPPPPKTSTATTMDKDTSQSLQIEEGEDNRYVFSQSRIHPSIHHHTSAIDVRLHTGFAVV